MSEEYLPSRFKHSNVDRFTRILQGVVNDSREVRFKHDDINLNANTAINRIRDAALAVMRGKVFLESVDADRLRENWPLYKVDYDHMSREVVVRRYKDRPLAVEGNFLDAELLTGHPFFIEVLTAYATLYNYQVYRGKLIIFGLLDDQVINELRTRFQNIDLITISPTEHILI